MLHRLVEKGPWFRAKRFGYGAGLPFAWQGWVVTAAFLGVVIGGGLVLPVMMPWWLVIALQLFATGAFLVVVHQRTEDGWQWRRGDCSKSGDPGDCPLKENDRAAHAVQ